MSGFPALSSAHANASGLDAVVFTGPGSVTVRSGAGSNTITVDHPDGLPLGDYQLRLPTGALAAPAAVGAYGIAVETFDAAGLLIQPGEVQAVVYAPLANLTITPDETRRNHTPAAGEPATGMVGGGLDSQRHGSRSTATTYICPLNSQLPRPLAPITYNYPGYYEASARVRAPGGSLSSSPLCLTPTGTGRGGLNCVRIALAAPL